MSTPLLPPDRQAVRYLAEMPAWRSELEALRPLLRDAGLREEFKWRKPCYTYDGANIVIFQPFKEFCALLFFKGVLLDDPAHVLKEQGENTRSALRMEFRSVGEVTSARSIITALLRDAIRVERAGLTVPGRAPTADGPYPDELVEMLAADPSLAEAWAALTPGRRRSWLLHFNAAKQSPTRTARVARAVPRILAGAGRND